MSMGVFLYTGLALVLTAVLIWCVKILFKETREYRKALETACAGGEEKREKADLKGAEERRFRKGEEYVSSSHFRHRRASFAHPSLEETKGAAKTSFAETYERFCARCDQPRCPHSRL